MWNRLFKSKSSKANSSKKSNKLSNIIRHLSTSNDLSGSRGKVVSDSDELIDAGNENIELRPCSICTRTFTPDALDKHVAVCEKMRYQKRTPFDSFRQRRGGTDLESYSPSNYGLIAKPKTSKSPYLEHKANSKSTVYSDGPVRPLGQQQRASPPKMDAIRYGSKETPLMNRSMKRGSGPINEICPQCGRSFGSRAYDRHVDWCREKARIAHPTMSAQQHLARERMQARTKYKAPSVASKREKNREKYSSLSESMNNLSDTGGISIADFNSVADPYESHHRKSSIMSLSMTSSMLSEGGLSDKYDPFMSAKRQFDDLFSPTMTASTPNNGFKAASPGVSSAMNAKSPSSPTKIPNVSKSTASFRRTSSLRVPKKSSPVSYMPKYKPTIQRGISDEGPMSANFMKSEEYDELPVKSHAIIPPDLVPKSPKLSHRSGPAASPPVRKRTSPTNRKHSLAESLANADFRLTKTDSLAAFLEFEHDMNEMNESASPEQELADDSYAAPSKHSESDSECNANSMDTTEPINSMDGDLAKRYPDPIAIECNNNDIRIDANRNPADSNNFNICDNLLLGHATKTNDEPARAGHPSDDIDEQPPGGQLSRSTSEGSIILNEKHELIINTRNDCIDVDKRNPKRQIRYLKDSLLFDNANDNVAPRDSAREPPDSDGKRDGGGDRHASGARKTPLAQRDSHAADKSQIVQQSRDIEALFDDFDLEEFISTFNDNEQFPIFKNYKDQQHTTTHRPSVSPATVTNCTQNELDAADRRRDDNAIRDEYRVSHMNECNNTYSAGLRKPDVTAEAEKCLEIENEQHKRTATPIKLAQLKDILGNSDVMTQTERELLASVQELSNMCDDSKTLDLSSMSMEKNNNPYTVDSIFRSERTADATPFGRSIRFNQWNRQQPVLSYQVPEIINVSSISSRPKDLSPKRLATAPPYAGPLAATKADTKHVGGSAASTAVSIPSAFDRLLPPITMHKNDSQNIYNTINMLSNNYKQFHRLESGADSAGGGSGGGGGAGLGFAGQTDYKLSTSAKRREPLNENVSKMSKFCYECGAKYIYDQAKFCVECGVKRVVLD